MAEQIEQSGNRGLLAAASDQLCRAAAAQQKIDGVYQNRFASSRLPGYHGESRTEGDGKVVDDSKITDLQIG